MKKRPLILLVVIIVIGLTLLSLHSSHGSSQVGSPKAYAAPSQQALSTIKQYLQAREDSVGADQSSPTAWLSKIKPFVTGPWLARLQPNRNSSTSSVPFDYIYAHQNGFIVHTSVTGCYWQGLHAQPTAASGDVLCSLSDETINKTTGAVVPASSLQIGWTRTGQQPAPNLSLVYQSGHWLINSDDTGAGH